MDKLIKFITLTHEFQQITRRVLVNGSDRQENDVEHSYQLALVAWYLIESEKFPLDINKALKYALIHDLVEVYAGDTYFYATEAEKSDKAAREHQVLERLKQEFPEGAEIFCWIDDYEKREDAESKFIYALDKLITPINIYLDGGRTWKADNVIFQKLFDGKDDKIAVSSEVKKYWDELVDKLRAQEKELFPVL